MVVHCKVCGKQFASFRGLNGHMNAHLKRLAAEPNVGTTIDDAIMDAYLDEGESYEDAEIYARRAMNKLKHSAEEETLDDDEYWEPYLEALEDYWYSCVRYVNRAGDSYRNIVDFIGFWEEVAEESAHSLSYVCEKLWKFKYDAYRMVWNREAERSMDLVAQDLEPGNLELLENFNPEGRDYEGESVYSSVWGYSHGPPELKVVKEVFNPYWLTKQEGEPYAFDLFRSEENQYTPLSGKRRTKGRKQKWIPVAIDFLRQNGKSTAAEIYPSLPDYRGAGTPVNAMALSNRLIRMPDIFIVDKSRKPYTYTLADTEMNAEFEQLSDAVVAVTDRYDENVGYVVATDGDDEDIDFDNVGVAVLDDDMEPIAEIEIGQTYFGYDKEDDDYYHSEQYYAAESGVSTIKVYVENEDKRIGGKEVSFEISNHTLANEDILHEAIENRLMDILQEPFGGWMLISTTPVDKDAEHFSSEEPEFNYTGSLSGIYQRGKETKPLTYYINYRCTHDIDSDYESDIEDHVKEVIYDDGDSSGFVDFDMTMGFYDGEIEVEGDVTWGFSDTVFEANFNPNQPRDSEGRWVEQVEVSEMIESEPLMDLDIDELEALATAIRLQDETFPEVGMLLEQIGDTAENRQVIFDEMIVVMSNLVNQSITPETETPEDYYQYILEEPADDEIERIYRQANYYAQFKNSIEINAYLDELMEQYTIAKEMGATDDIVADIERDINFVELVSRVQNMQREFQAPDWNPVQPRVPQSPCKGGKCVKPGECKSCNNPGPSGGPPGKGGKGGANPMGPPMPPTDNQEKLFVNKLDGSLWTGKTQPNADWRPVTYIPITQNGQQKYIRNIMDDIVKLFPPSAVVYRRKPPLLVITDLKFNIDMLANHGFKIKNREITYA